MEPWALTAHPVTLCFGVGFFFFKEDETMIDVTLKGGVVKQYEAGVTVADVAKSLGMGLYKAVSYTHLTLPTILLV